MRVSHAHYRRASAQGMPWAAELARNRRSRLSGREIRQASDLANVAGVALRVPRICKLKSQPKSLEFVAFGLSFSWELWRTRG